MFTQYSNLKKQRRKKENTGCGKCPTLKSISQKMSNDDACQFEICKARRTIRPIEKRKYLYPIQPILVLQPLIPFSKRPRRTFIGNLRITAATVASC